MKLAAHEVSKKLENKSEGVCYIDVRGIDEYRSGHVPGATCIPLDQLSSNVNLIPKDKLVILGCQGGVRSRKAFELLQQKGFTNIADMEGGMSAWIQSGLPVNRLSGSSVIPLMRQVQIAAGSLVLTGVLLGASVDPKFYGLSGFVGAGLIFAGISGWCGMAKLLQVMPWNRT